VWEVIASPGNLAYCHPFCEQNPVHEWPGVGARDEVIYFSGWVFERNFIEWLPGVGYSLDIGRKGGRQTHVIWRINSLHEALHEGDSTLTITLEPSHLQRLPVIVRWAPHYLQLHPMMRRYLSAVLKGFEYYLTTGQAVERNQFGAHPWFSPKVRRAAT
jgi:hypothetical protein